MREPSMQQLVEIVSKEELIDFDDVIRRLGHCRKALGLANGFKDPADRKKYKGLAMSNLNRVRAALTRLAEELKQDV